MLLVGVFLLWPLIWILAISFTRWNGYGPISFDGLSTWTSLFADPGFQSALEHSLIWLGLTATVPVAAGFVMAVAMQRGGIIGPVARAIAVVPLLLPPAVAATTWLIAFNPNYGPLNASLRLIGLGTLQPDWLGDPRLAFWSVFAVALWSSAGLSMLIFSAALRSIDASYFDLARAEGAGPWQTLRSLIVPACRRASGLAVIVTVVLTSQVFDLLYVLTNGGPGGATLMLPLDMYLRAFTGLTNVSQGVADAALQVVLGVALAIGALALTVTHPSLAGEGDYRRPTATPSGTGISALAGLLVALPLVWTLTAAFTSGRAAILQPLSISWPPSGSAFVTAWNAGIGSGLGQSLLIALVVVGLTLLLALPAAFQLQGPGVARALRGVLLVLLLITLVQPGEAYLIPLFYLVQQLNLGDSLAGLVIIEVARVLPFAVLLLWIFMRSLSADLLASVRLEAGWGARALLRVVAPLAAPAAAATALWVFVSSWSEFTLPTLLLSNPGTAPVALRYFAGTHDTEFNLLAAGTLLVIAPVVLALVLAYGPAARGLRAVGRSMIT